MMLVDVYIMLVLLLLAVKSFCFALLLTFFCFQSTHKRSFFESALGNTFTLPIYRDLVKNQHLLSNLGANNQYTTRHGTAHRECSAKKRE